MGKITKKELVKIIIDNFTDEDGDIFIDDLDFKGISGDVYAQRWKVPNNLIRGNCKVGGGLSQPWNTVSKDLIQDYNDVGRYLIQGNNKVVGYIYDYDNKAILKLKSKKELFIEKLSPELKKEFEALELEKEI